MNDGIEILKNINAALKSRKLYPKGHPATIAPVRKGYQLITDELRSRNNIAVAVVQGALVFEDRPVPDYEIICPEIIEYMQRHKVDTMIIERGVQEKEMTDALEILGGEEELEGKDLQKELSARSVVHITLKSVPEGKKNMLEVYNGAVDVVRDVMGEVRMGKIPKSEPVNNIIDEMTEAVFTDQNAMIGLTMIKSYDNYLYNHSVNVSVLALSLARAMGLEDSELHAVGVAALLHDVGKTGVSEDIIRKPGGLSSDEWEKVKQHPVLGSDITKRMDGMLEMIGRLIYEHHIKYDHSGYPETTSTLHPYSQIITISDAYDALTTLRVYQQPHSPAEAIKVMSNFSGRHFNPETLKAFIGMLGVYPVGTMVRLTTNEVCIVVSVNKDEPDLPVVRVVYDRNGDSIEEPFDIDLSSEVEGDRKIAALVNPETKAINIDEFFEKAASETDEAV